MTYAPRLLRLALWLSIAAPFSLLAQQGAKSAAAPVPAPAAPSPQKAATRDVKLSRLADSLSNYLVFPPIGDTAFVVASRNKRMLVDIGRVDAEVRKDSAKAWAYREAVEKRSPVTVGTKFMLRAPWGVEEVTATSVDTWNGRIVLRISGSTAMDSLARGKNTVVATAVVAAVGTVNAAQTDSCDRMKPLSPELSARVTVVRDSLLDELRKGPQPLYERLKKKMSLSTSQVTGCFGGTGRVALVASLKAANTEWVREKLVIIDELGKITSLRVNDLRFRAHELLQAFDANGDGVDDLGTRATTERAGATTVLLLDLKGKKLVRFAQGFSWEEM